MMTTSNNENDIRSIIIAQSQTFDANREVVASNLTRP